MRHRPSTGTGTTRTRTAPVRLAILVALPLAAATLGACGDDKPVEDLTFPASFVFGAAVAGFQVEAGCPTVAAAECEDRHSDWYHFVTDPELVKSPGLYQSGDPISAAPGFYELYPDDVRRAAEELKSGGLRLSIEWSRVFPTSTVGVEGNDALKKIADPRALAYYHGVLAELRKRGLRPFVTVNHYSLPDWIHDTVGCHDDITKCTKKGWADREIIVRELGKYGGFLGAEFGGEVDLWASLNEPLTAVVLAGFIFPSATRSNPPGTSLRFDEARTAMLAMIEAHARVYDALQASDKIDVDGDGKPARVGIVYNLQAVVPYDASDDIDKRGAEHCAYLMNQAFLDAVAKGDLDADLSGKQVHRDDLAGRLDFIGVNYYARVKVPGTPSAVLPRLSELTDFNLLALEYDYDYPRGIYEVLMFAKRYGVPLFISETGFEDKDDKGGASAWVARTLRWVKRAIAEGAPVEGYFYWTLMDNYEWNHGMQIRLGLYAVDGKDPKKTRRARSSVATFAAIAGARAIPADIAAKYPIE